MEVAVIKNIDFYNKKRLYFLFLAASAIALLFCSMTSPLFPIHNRVDQNTFMTFGREMMNGKVLYRDLFDHKGPYIYLIHGLGYLITGDNFHGVWLIEVLFFWVFLIYIYKICSLYLQKKPAVATTFITCVAVATCASFIRGDNAEEFCLTLWAFGIYHLLKIKDKKPPIWLFFAGGICAGVVLCLKFTLLGFWAAWGIILFIKALKARGLRYGIAGGLLFLGGMFLAVLPWIIHFGLHNAVYDWLYVSYYVNIAYYTSPYPNWVRPFFALFIGGENFALDPILTISIIYSIKNYKLFGSDGKILIATFAAQFILMSLGGVYYVYYFLILIGHSVFGFIALYKNHGEKIKSRFKTFKPKSLAAAFILACVLGSNCFQYYFYTKKNYVQYQFAEIISQTPDAKILNYGFLDGGFYYASKTSPITKYIGKPNLDDNKYPQMEQEYRRLIADKTPDYVIIRMKRHEILEDESCPELYENYTIIKKGYNFPDNYIYYLFAKNSD